MIFSWFFVFTSATPPNYECRHLARRWRQWHLCWVGARRLGRGECQYRPGSTPGLTLERLKWAKKNSQKVFTWSPGRRTGRAILACWARRAMFRARTASFKFWLLFNFKRNNQIWPLYVRLRLDTSSCPSWHLRARPSVRLKISLLLLFWLV